ncbi:centrosomal protein of 290 kDa [Gastrophryne carolinensis]
MAPLDWGKLMKVDPDLLPTQERVAEKMLKTLSKVSSTDLKAEPNDNLVQLFRIAQSLMKMKSQEVDLALEEAEKAGEEQAKTENQLKSKIKQLENEMEMAQLSTGSRDSRFLREEIRQLEEQLGQRERELKDSRTELEKEKQVNERLALRNEETDNENSKLRRENEQLRQDVIDYQRQIDSQRESVMSRGEGQDYKALISKKNMELVQYLDEIQSLSEANERLEAQNQEMTKNLEESVQEMEKMTDEYSKMKLVVQQTDSAMDRLRKEKEQYRLQVLELTEQLKAKNEEDDPVMIAVNTKVEEWKRILASKDEEIMEYQQMIHNLREKLKVAQLDADKNSVLTLQQGLQERDSHIKMLTEQLEQHTKEMELHCLHIGDLKQQLKSNKGNLHPNLDEEFQAKLQLMDKRLGEAEHIAELAENDAQQKDKDLADALKRMKEYELGIYGLEEAVAEIKELKTNVNIRDREIEALTADINKLEIKLNDVLDENEDLRERLGLDPKTVIDLTTFRNVKTLKQQQYRAENQILLKEIECLEEERLELKQQIRKLAQEKGKGVASLGVTADSLLLNQSSMTDSRQKSFSFGLMDNTEDFRVKVRIAMKAFIFMQPAMMHLNCQIVLPFCKDWKASGPDGISTTCLKVCAEQIAPVLTIISKRSLETGIVSDYLKNLVIIPVAKTSSATDLNYFRPIALTPVVMKVFKRLLRFQVTKSEHLSKELNSKEKELKRSKTIVAELKSKSKELSEENKQLQKAMAEILQAIKDSQKDLKKGEATLIIPSLERLVHAFETKNSGGIFDASVHLKAQLDQLTGRNEEVRQELKESRKEAANLSNLLSKANDKISSLENEITLLLQSEGANIVFRALNLPEGLSPSSTSLINSLNEYLLHLLQEVESKEQSVSKLEGALEEYKRKIAVMRHQQGLVYKEYQSERETWEQEMEKIKEENSKLESQKEQDAVQIKEYYNLLESLKMDPDDLKKLMAENSRKMTVLRVNEKSLTRRYTTLLELEQHLRKENGKLRDEILEMEAAVGERLGYLQRYKDVVAFKIASLQKALDNSVPISELESANREYNELTAKYRDMLQKDNLLVQRSSNLEHLEYENASLQSQISSYMKELEITKEKLYTIEQAWEHIGELGGRSSMDKSTKAITNNEIVSVSKKITMLEMKELNERQRAEHSQTMYEHLRATLKQVEERNFELESKFAELTKINLEAQKVEQQLRDELADSVSKTVSEADRRKILELERSEVELKVEVSKLRSLSDIAKTQVSTMVSRQQSREKEVESLRKQVLDFQDQTDEKALIAKLHQQIVALQVSESTAVAKLEAAATKLRKLEAYCLRLEQKMDAKEQALYYARLEGRNRAKHLRQTIQTLRRQFSGTLPLAQQEKFSKTMIELQNDKLKTIHEMQLAQQERRDTETRAMELELKLKGLEELVATLKDVRGAEKVAEWHKKIEEIRLQDMKINRELNQKKEEIKYLNKIIADQEKTIIKLEEDLVQQGRSFEERQIAWDQREVQLERQLDMYEQQQQEVLCTARKFEEATGEMPDSSAPLPQQLDIALRKIKEHVRTILETKAVCKALEEKLKEKEALLRTAEQNVLSRDKVINELRLRIPAVIDREKLLSEFHQKDEDSEMRQALKVAHQTIENMQAWINQKEEVVEKYQHLLAKAREEQKENAKKHAEDLKVLHQKLDLYSDASVSKFKENALELMKRPALEVPSSTHLLRVAEMEQTVAEQEKSLATLASKLKAVTFELESQKSIHLSKVNDFQNQRARLEEHYMLEIKKHKGDSEELRTRLAEMEKEIQYLNTELETQKEANTRAPTATMKNLVERLKNQVIHKEKQQKALSKALLALRAEMTSHAEQQLISTAAQKEENLNIQQIIDRQTKELKARIEDLNEEQLKLKEALRSSKARENNLTKDLENLNQELRVKQKSLNKTQKEKDEVEKENEELKKRVKRLVSSTQNKSDLDSKQNMIDELQKKIKKLEVELEKKSEEVERKPAREDKSSKEEIIRWEEGKKWQNKLEGLRSKLRDKEKEVESLTKQLSTLKELYSKSDQEKSILQKKLKSRGVTVDQVVGARTLEYEKEIEELKQKKAELENEVSHMKTKQALPRDAVVDELHLKNRFLQEKLQALERQLSKENLSRPSEDAVNPERFDIFSFETNSEHKPRHTVFPNKKRNLLKIANIHVNGNLKLIPGKSTHNIENGSATDFTDANTDHARCFKTPEVTPLANAPILVSRETSPQDASLPTSTAASPKLCDISLPVSTTATPGLDDASHLAQANDEQESYDGNDSQNICDMTSASVSRAATNQGERCQDDCGEHLDPRGTIIEDEMSELKVLADVSSKTDVSTISEFEQQKSPCSDIAEGETDILLSGTSPFDYSCNELGSKCNAFPQTSGVGSEDQSSKEMELQKENLRLSAENVELHFQLEQANKDLPRLKDQLATLKEMCELLKKDKLEAERKLGNVRGSGKSGKTIPELEKTIGLMKRVVERVQRENEELKKAPGVVTNEKLSSLKLENERLKSELEKLQLHVGGQLSMRYEAKTKGIEKVITENERLRKELKQETETSEKLRIEKRNLVVINEKLTSSLEETKSKLNMVESRGPHLEGVAGKAWKSAAISKMYETQMKEMEAELIKKNDSIVDLKRLLKEVTDREQNTEQTIQQLKEEIEILKHFPKDIKTDGGFARDFQITQLANKRLEDEKAELAYRLEMYKQKSGSAGSDGALDSERIHKLMEEVVNLQTHIKTSDLEKQHLKEEIKRLKKELENFDPSFFEEIEDLKYNYNEEVKKNIVLEEKLKAVSEQFGVHVDIPANVDC